MLVFAFVAAYFFDAPGWAAFWIVLHWLGGSPRCSKCKQ